MIPIHGPIYGALFSVANRLVSGDADLSEENRDKLEDARNGIEDVSDLVGDLSPVQPATWGRFAGRLMDETFGTKRRYESAREALQDRGFDRSVRVPSLMFTKFMEFAESLDPDELYCDGSDRLVTLHLRPDMEVCAQRRLEPESPARIWYQADERERAPVLSAIREVLWKNWQAIRIDYGNEGVVVRKLDLEDFTYHGDQIQMIDRWRAFRQEGIRRSVLLEGPPGCGKTTFCCHAARRLADRVVQVEAEMITRAQLEDWIELLELLEPEVLIVDDIDRLADGRGAGLEERLNFFEEGICPIPFTFFTSNDHTRLPAAMRRPGRIDRVVEFDEPDESVRRDIIGELARREEIEVPADQIPRLLELHQDYSAAHVVEALRRARIDGWDESRIDDVSFRLQCEVTGRQDWLRINGYRRFDIKTVFVIEELRALADVDVAYADDRDRLLRLVLPNGARICIEDDNRGRPPDFVYFRNSADGIDATRRGISELFWQHRRAVLLDAIRNDGISCRPMDPGGYEYYGPLVDMIEDWREFRRAGLRRSALIQGPPGCGKSTFCLHAADELSDRTLVLTPDFYDHVRCGQWRILTGILRPEMVVVDDVDRVSEHSLDSKLRLFEENHCDIPYVLFTSNDHEKLPEPMRRPGRIDQLIEVERPSMELRWKLIREMARREGLVDVPDEQLERLDAILRDQSTAHLIEALRRAKVKGWESLDSPRAADATFVGTSRKTEVDDEPAPGEDRRSASEA